MREALDKQISFYRNVVGLGRDIVLIVIAVLTVAITSLGGNPGSLNASDWARLVGFALLTVLAPLICFLVFRVIKRFLGTYFSFPLLLPLPGDPLPRGVIAWCLIRLVKKYRRLSSFGAKRAYVNSQRRAGQELKSLSDAHRGFRLLIGTGRLIFRLNSLTYRADPYIAAIVTLIVIGLVFWDVLTRYTP